MNKLQQELQNRNNIRESDISQLPYLNACVKETVRMHPPIPLLPHSAQSTCQVMNYTVPKDSLVFVNLWAIGHDSMVWEDYELLPFGAGRRMCPGLPYANKQVHLILASLIGCFNWSVPNNGDPSELEMNEKYAVPFHKDKPLLLIPLRKTTAAFSS
ncbi:hypothetical protein BUALT_Bualt10G0099300 [Buddleja alternifolia]|uniref:Cytochrome P450 n=1 Tax=Buddleja alternifolia TaxID=168488 RepID=A0AAV6WWP4_9LAMI|nr:hypothetical protein BUALT_Bualt10G0099300 [Buddleja alternifolia]